MGFLRGTPSLRGYLFSGAPTFWITTPVEYLPSLTSTRFKPSSFSPSTSHRSDSPSGEPLTNRYPFNFINPVEHSATTEGDPNPLATTMSNSFSYSGILAIVSARPFITLNLSFLSSSPETAFKKSVLLFIASSNVNLNLFSWFMNTKLGKPPPAPTSSSSPECTGSISNNSLECIICSSISFGDKKPNSLDCIKYFCKLSVFILSILDHLNLQCDVDTKKPLDIPRA
jgi:hypothetical protein